MLNQFGNFELYQFNFFPKHFPPIKMIFFLRIIQSASFFGLFNWTKNQLGYWFERKIHGFISPHPLSRSIFVEWSPLRIDTDSSILLL